jgi:hypothetical protein
MQFGRAPAPQAFDQFMLYIFFRGEQAFETSFSFLIVAIHVDQNLRGAAIVGDMHRSHSHQSDARIGEFAFHQRFDLLAQRLAQPAAMILNRALLHDSPRSKTHENIRKTNASVGSDVPLPRTKESFS